MKFKWENESSLTNAKIFFLDFISYRAGSFTIYLNNSIDILNLFSTFEHVLHHFVNNDNKRYLIKKKKGKLHKITEITICPSANHSILIS